MTACTEQFQLPTRQKEMLKTVILLFSLYVLIIQIYIV